MSVQRVMRHVLALVLTVLLGGLLAATLVRAAPGFGVDEREMDSRLAEQSLQALRRAAAPEQSILWFYGRHLAGWLRGDWGFSRSLQRPAAELLAERVPVTLRSAGLGLATGWLLTLVLAVPGVTGRRAAFDVVATGLSSVFLCLPAAALALLVVLAGGSAPLALGCVLFPRIFRYARNLLSQAAAMPHVVAARARGLSPSRILLRHVLPVAGPQMAALAGVSVSMAFGAAIPIEVICDSPGVGQLAWQAALGRDLPLLVNLTVLVTVVTLAVNAAADLAVAAWGRRMA